MARGPVCGMAVKQTILSLYFLSILPLTPTIRLPFFSSGAPSPSIMSVYSLTSHGLRVLVTNRRDIYESLFNAQNNEI